MDYLRLIIKSLNQIDVKGADNLDRLLGCIQGLERLDKDLDTVTDKAVEASKKVAEVSKSDHHDEQRQDLPSSMG